MATELLDAWYNDVWRTIRRYSAGSAAGITTRSSVASRWSISAKPCSNRLHPLVEPLAVFAPVVPETLKCCPLPCRFCYPDSFVMVFSDSTGVRQAN